MFVESFKEFSQKYKTSLDDDNVINMLLDDKVRSYIINHDNIDFLACIAASNSDKLRDFYFQEKCITSMINLDKFSKVLYKSDFFPNKIKLFDNDFFLKSLTLDTNTKYAVKQIISEIKNHTDNLKLISTLKDGLCKLMDYLKLDFKNNIESITSFMKELSDELYYEFLDYILDDLKSVAKENKEMVFDELFSKVFWMSEKTFLDVENIINKFKGIDNLYYCSTLLDSLIEISVDYQTIIISEQELNRLKEYIFNDYCKEIFLKNLGFGYSALKRLYLCFSDEIIDYFLDDVGLMIIDNNHKFSQLLDHNIPFDKLTHSKLFAKLLSKNYSSSYKYDNRIKALSLDNKSLFNLLDSYLELKDYSHFFRIFGNISAEEQLIYYKNNVEKLLKLNNNEIFKGMKKEVYKIFEDKTRIKDWTYSAYDLNAILNDKDSYSIEQLENIFSNIENIITILKTDCLENIYKKILNLNNVKLTNIYMSNEIQTFLRKTNQLDRIYIILNELKIDISPLLLNDDNLIDIGEKVLDEYQKEKRKNFGEDFHFISNYYPHFLAKIPYINDEYLLFRILNFYLENAKYLPVFNILINEVPKENLQEYFSINKNLITVAIQKYDYDISLIWEKIPYPKQNQFFKERDKSIIYLGYYQYYYLFKDEFAGFYHLDEKILNDERFIEKFIDHPNDAKTALRLVTDNEDLIKKLTLKIKLYNNMKSKILKNLNDSKEEFKTYLKILINSNVDVYEIEFLNDMINIVFFNKKIEEVFFKYKNINLENIKLEILNNLIKTSRENIASSIHNPLNKDITYVEYNINNKKIVVPTIVYNDENYIFLVRSMDADNSQSNNNEIKCYSVITEKNRSVYYGDIRIKFGYIKVKPEDIIQVNSFDAISNNSTSNKYTESYIKYPEWISMEELNDRTLKNKSYSELRIKGEYIPDFVISYDEPNVDDLMYLSKNNVPLVKILRKSYPNSIEQCEDPYSNWK